MSNLIFPDKIHGLSPQVVKTSEWGNVRNNAPNGFVLRIANFGNPLWHFHLEYNYLYDQYPSLQNVRSYNPYSDVQYFMGFYNQMRGGFDDFLFKDESDYSAAGLLGGVWEQGRTYPAGGVIIDGNGHAQVTDAGGTAGTLYPLFSDSGGNTTDGSITWGDKGEYPKGWPNATVQLPLVTDGLGNWYSPLQRKIAGMGAEDVTDVIPGTLAVFANGVEQSFIELGGPTLEGPGLAIPGASYAGMYVAWGTAQPTAPITANFEFYFRMMFEEDTQDFEKWAQQLWTIGGSKAKNGSGYVKLVTSRAATI